MLKPKCNLRLDTRTGICCESGKHETLKGTDRSRGYCSLATHLLCYSTYIARNVGRRWKGKKHEQAGRPTKGITYLRGLNNHILRGEMPYSSCVSKSHVQRLPFTCGLIGGIVMCSESPLVASTVKMEQDKHI